MSGHRHVSGSPGWGWGWLWLCCDGMVKVRVAALAIGVLLALQYCVSVVVTGRHGGYFLGGRAAAGSDTDLNGSSARRLLSQTALMRRARLDSLLQVSVWANSSDNRAGPGLLRLLRNVSSRTDPTLPSTRATRPAQQLLRQWAVKTAPGSPHNASGRLQTGISSFSSSSRTVGGVSSAIGTPASLPDGGQSNELPPELSDNGENQDSPVQSHVPNKIQPNANTITKYETHSRKHSSAGGGVTVNRTKQTSPSSREEEDDVDPPPKPSAGSVKHGSRRHKTHKNKDDIDSQKRPAPTPTKSNPHYDLVYPVDEVNRTSQGLPSLTPGAPPYCPITPPGLRGLLPVSYSRPSYEDLKEDHQEVQAGGRWHPKDCTARNKVAIIIPYRNRDDHLRVFLHHMHPFLQKQQLDYGIYVVEMAYPTKFNRAMLFNIGFIEAQKDYDWQCYIFHDVDLLPEEDHNLYTCPERPRHMSAAVDTMAYRLPYATIMGGVVAIRKEQYEQVNGFSNMFFGWGAEDDDFYNRVRHHGLRLTRYPMRIARYRMLRHYKSKASDDRFKYLNTGERRFKMDGLNSLEYKLLQVIRRKLFTWIHVEVNQARVQSMFMEDEEEEKVPEGLLDPQEEYGVRQTKHLDFSHTKRKSGSSGNHHEEQTMSPLEKEARELRKSYLEQIHKQLQEELKKQYDKRLNFEEER